MINMLEKILRKIEKIIPKKVYTFFQPYYHFALGFLGALLYGFPSNKLTVIAVTGTKGKSTTSEILFNILNEAGVKTSLISTIKFAIGNKTRRNLLKMTTPGRFSLQKFLNKSVKEGCTHAVIEISSEATLLYRHRFIKLDGLIFTNLSPEHIERHGSYENYRDAKLNIARHVLSSENGKKILTINTDDKEAPLFENLGKFKVINKVSINNAKPFETNCESSHFTWREKAIETKLIGEFNILNALLAMETAKTLGVSEDNITKTIEKISLIRGRLEKIDMGQNFLVVVDYAHTADSLEKLYGAFLGKRKICVLGGTGGGRDKWKRPKMGEVASRYCDEIILTNEDPYDEDPEKIISDIRTGISNNKVEVIIDRRRAINRALRKATADSAVLISGKGTDPYIMGPNNTKEEWDDAKVAREELEKVLTKK
jgi:UDP-N-acetylmuramoyl-L-alanyl-D-glutamate--2,6-diaminopimelate ligase